MESEFMELVRDGITTHPRDVMLSNAWHDAYERAIEHGSTEAQAMAAGNAIVEKLEAGQ
jgi:hypothetical protein